MRLIFYLFDIASDDEVTQKKGFILVYFNVGLNKVGDPQAVKMLAPLIGSMAVKISSFHYCYEHKHSELVDQTLLSAFISTTQSETRVRFRIHCGEEV